MIEINDGPYIDVGDQRWLLIRHKFLSEDVARKLGLDYPHRPDVLSKFFDANAVLPGTLVRHGRIAHSGMAFHIIRAEHSIDASAGFSAQHLHLPSSEHADSEFVGNDLSGVLRRNFWIPGWGNRKLRTRDGLDLLQDFADRLEKVVGGPLLAYARRQIGSDDIEACRGYLFEIAAQHFAEPLSSLWYAANIYSLIYARKDMLRAGYLLGEFEARKRFESIVIKHYERLAKNRQNGKKGGQADRRRRQYSVLDEAAFNCADDIAMGSDSAARRRAQTLASAHDANSDSLPLFSINGKPLSASWFDDWVVHFRLLAREIKDASQQQPTIGSPAFPGEPMDRFDS